MGRIMPNEEAVNPRLSPAVAYFNFVLTDDEDGAQNRDDDGHLYRFAREAEGQLYSQVQRKVRETLGESYRVEDFTLEEGSLIVTFTIAAAAFFKTPAGELLLDFTRYEALIKSASLLMSQLSSLFQRFFRGFARAGNVQVNGSWQPSAAVLTHRAPQLQRGEGVSADRFLLVYVVSSHAILLIVLLWLVIHKLR